MVGGQEFSMGEMLGEGSDIRVVGGKDSRVREETTNSRVGGSSWDTSRVGDSRAGDSRVCSMVEDARVVYSNMQGTRMGDSSMVEDAREVCSNM